VLLPYLALAAAQLVGLVLIPVGLPGLWVQVGALALYGWLTGFQTVGAASMIAVLVLAGIGETAEFVLGGRYARRAGGGRRAEWGAVLGGVAGAVVGLPLPILGSVVGAFVGSFAGAALLELTRGRGTVPALKVGWGAFVGRIVATALKAAIGVSIAAVALIAALR
jgi:uncharacterized protein YqgC (DUF456 family)